MSLPQLLLLPGLASDADVWRPQMDALAGLATFTVIDYGSCDSQEAMAEVALRRAPRRFAVAGHSMGGRVALEVMRRAPDRVTGLALLDTTYGGRAVGEDYLREKERRHAFIDVAREEGMRAMAHRWLPNLVAASRLLDGPLVSSIVEMIARKSPDIFAAQVHSLLERPDATSLLAEIRCPTVVLCGREDDLTPLPVSYEIVQRIPGSRLVIIDNCGHMTTMERPEEVSAALREWLKSVPVIE